MRLAIAAVLAVAIGGPANARFDPCQVRTFAAPSADATLDVHAEPSATSQVVATVPAEFAELEIRETRNGWFRVAVIENAESGRTMFLGRGWVVGEALMLSISGGGDRTFYAQPNQASRPVLRGLGGGETPQLVGCEGDWAKVRLGDHVGWLAPSGQCSNALTTCS